MNKIDFQNGFALGLASGGVVEVDNAKEEQEKTVDITENGTTEVLPDENKVLSKVTVNVDVPVSGGDTLPDWDDDSPVIASGEGGSSNCVWELTEKGTLRWKMLDKNLTLPNVHAIAGWNSSALSAISLDYQAISPKIKQAYFEDGFTQNELCFAVSCERVRFSNTLTKRPTISALTSLKEMDASGALWEALPDYICNRFVTLEKVTLNPLVVTIPRDAFSYCYSLKEINLENITTFGMSCLNESFSLDKDIVFNANLTSIAANAFARTRIKSVKFQNSADNLPTIANNAFNQCRALTEIYCPWSEGAVAYAPWGATNATIHYNYVEENTNAES